MFFFGRIENKRIQLWDKARWRDYVSKLDGEEVEVELKKRVLNRSQNQNAFYWVICRIAGDHFGYEESEMHEAFKFQFLRKEERGKPLTVRSTAGLSIEEFKDYLDKVIRFCGTEGIVVPDPEMWKAYLEK